MGLQAHVTPVAAAAAPSPRPLPSSTAAPGLGTFPFDSVTEGEASTQLPPYRRRDTGITGLHIATPSAPVCPPSHCSEYGCGLKAAPLGPLDRVHVAAGAQHACHPSATANVYASLKPAHLPGCRVIASAVNDGAEGQDRKANGLQQQL